MAPKGLQVVKSLFKPAKSKTPAELVKETAELLSLQRQTLTGKDKERVQDELPKHLNALRVLLYGSTEAPPSAEAVSQVTAEVFQGHFLRGLVLAFKRFNLDTRQEATLIFACLMRQQVRSKPVGADYMLANSQLLDTLMQGYSDPDIASYFGSMLRDCARHQAVTKYLLYSPHFARLFDYIQEDNFDVSSDAGATLKELLLRHKATAVDFLLATYSQFFENFNKLLQSSTYITKRLSLQTLVQMFGDRAYEAVARRYSMDTHNLIITMTNMRDSSKLIQVESFRIFKVILTNPSMPVDVKLILVSNRDKLIRFLATLAMDKGSEAELAAFNEDKRLALEVIKALQQ